MSSGPAEPREAYKPLRFTCHYQQGPSGAERVRRGQIGEPSGKRDAEQAHLGGSMPANLLLTHITGIGKLGSC
jgi:hypothetical protein